MALLEKRLDCTIDKVQTAIDRLRNFEPQEGYWLAYSGGKDSGVIKRIAEMAGVKFEAHYSCTSVDPPELVRFIKAQKDVHFDIPRYPDGKAQITGKYDDSFKLKTIQTFTICYQNCETCREETDEIMRIMALNICEEYNIEVEKFLINPTGKFLIGGFEGDSGLTGRKIVVDAYQSFANVGGGAFSGKDMTKVDVSGAYKARQLAKRFLKEYNLRWCQVQLSYSIGIAEPMAVYVDSDKGNIEVGAEIYEECKPINIIKDLKLLEIDYREFAKFGHFRN